MQGTVREYDAKLDTKKRVTLRSVPFNYYHVMEYADGRIVMEPRELTAPFQISANSLAMMDESMQNLKEGKVSDKIDLSEFAD
jgi:ppGpp synthetase/RelA/SpoT-type nucleotidyltranferase